LEIGFIGSGNMARAIALGLNRPALFSDSGSGRAAALAEELGGNAVSSEAVAASSELIFLCHKPKHLAEVAAQIGSYDGIVVSVLAATPLSALREAYPSAKVIRSMPNLPVEFGTGVIAVATESDDVPTLNDFLGQLGAVVPVAEEQFELATAVAGCAPAFFALFARDLIESAVHRGMDEQLARELVGQTLAGTGDVLAANGVDTVATMKAVASPGGLTERALESFDASNLQDAVDRAVATVLGESS
jgi:pyrroline-5-carboxylate reductase